MATFQGMPSATSNAPSTPSMSRVATPPPTETDHSEHVSRPRGRVEEPLPVGRPRRRARGLRGAVGTTCTLRSRSMTTRWYGARPRGRLDDHQATIRRGTTPAAPSRGLRSSGSRTSWRSVPSEETDLDTPGAPLVERDPRVRRPCHELVVGLHPVRQRGSDQWPGTRAVGRDKHVVQPAITRSQRRITRRCAAPHGDPVAIG